MRIAVFGATGGTGREVVTRALEAGHEVQAAARRPEAVTTVHPRLEVRRADVYDQATVDPVVEGVDAVVSAIGVSGDRAPTTLYSEGTRAVVAAMTRAGVRRLVCMSSGGLDTDHPDVPVAQRLVTRWVVQRLYRNTFTDMARMEDMLRRSDLDWTVVRVPMLTDGPHTGRYRTAVNTRISRPSKVSRADLADWVVSGLDDARNERAVVEVSV